MECVFIGGRAPGWHYVPTTLETVEVMVPQKEAKTCCFDPEETVPTEAVVDRERYRRQRYYYMRGRREMAATYYTALDMDPFDAIEELLKFYGDAHDEG